jgi:hypothetical protein
MRAETVLNGEATAGVARKASRKAPLRRAGTLKRTAATKAGAARAKAVPKVARTSEILRGLLERDTGKSFTVKEILGSLGPTSFGTSLMVFSIPEVLPIPIPGISAIVAIPTGIISAQMAMGKREITLPKWLLKRSVPRKALAGAIRSILPVLERLERTVRPRWKWMTSAPARKFLGAFILLLAVLMGLPVPGTNMPLAIAVFIIALGLVERDGTMITAGLLLGLASIALVGGIFAGLMALFGRLFA